ncbi:HlyD family secretion protein [Rhodopila globiformis]|uniref:Uncharacterized protein n=1 Tax=Rhodopila globiformis TaxID=1071 RepID=A0A2S6MTU1_RHOGL|nr:biotin/lipoyl-binding protein [Rhodopila globiformis]PPQ25777.1 hypothetical protein CCS01_31930 [Rhodopila globiformis]
MKRFAIAIAALAVLAGGWFSFQRLFPGTPPGILYGNVEIRQVDLAFNSEGTVTSMPRQEGDPVKAGEAIARLDDATYRSAVAVAAARRDSAKAQLDKLVKRHPARGHRPGPRQPRQRQGDPGERPDKLQPPDGACRQERHHPATGG